MTWIRAFPIEEADERLRELMERQRALYPVEYALQVSPSGDSVYISKTSNVVFSIFPFRRMWLSAREGRLKVGDAAPDFSLETYDRKSRVQLSTFRGKKPVVLVFGSYT